MSTPDRASGNDHILSTSTATSTVLLSEENFLTLFELYSREL
jgi:hypothetical protein